MPSPLIQVSIINNRQGAHIGHLTLNKPKSLNALDLEMVEAMMEQLLLWKHDDAIAAVFIDSAGDKAFCAGGDIVSMYKAMSSQEHFEDNQAPKFMQDFFSNEYQLDYCLHTYNKPVICWGNGIIMGGGLGVFAGAGIKIVTETAKVAMPEITIGLFPDVGASYFLNKMPKGVGKFLGLTGASINAQDCIDIGLADYQLNHSQKHEFIETLTELPEVNEDNIQSALKALRNKSDQSNQQSGMLAQLFSDLENLHAINALSDIDAYLKNLIDERPNQRKYLSRAHQTFTQGSPITAHLVIEQLLRAKDLSLADCFRMELSMALFCSINREFQEGVRALLIDKDRQAKWKYADYNSVDVDNINAHFMRFDKQYESLLPMLEKDFGEHHE